MIVDRRTLPVWTLSCVIRSRMAGLKWTGHIAGIQMSRPAWYWFALRDFHRSSYVTWWAFRAWCSRWRQEIAGLGWRFLVWSRLWVIENASGYYHEGHWRWRTR